ncbi:FkbM family methyltransferase [Microvirga alba]|uniref:FkbM family methyltransferase n=1 Tax=Microvirga alba TaxID=2791025 RepID=A0A931FRT8_9HYPH|nr:FkbM family methyltransferase [Microvirga alba]MBF9233076.1 FkbM family methyltransferase [Microvirga alba]
MSALVSETKHESFGSFGEAPFGAFSPSTVTGFGIALTRRLPRGWFGRRAALIVRRAVRWLLQGRPVDTVVFGARMRLFASGNTCEGRILFTPHHFDPDELSFLDARVREGFKFVDVGANVGPYTFFAASLGARVLAFEPQPDLFDRLAYNLRQNDLPNVKAVNCALADRDGDVVMFIDTRNKGQSSIQIMPAGETLSSLKVNAITLLRALQEEAFERPDLVKLDVEGAEGLILEPFFREAPEHLWPLMFMIERTHYTATNNAAQALERVGYNLMLTTRLNMVYERIPDA